MQITGDNNIFLGLVIKEYTGKTITSPWNHLLSYNRNYLIPISTGSRLKLNVYWKTVFRDR